MSFFYKVYLYVLKRTQPIEYARKIGVKVGERCKFIGSPNWGSEPWLISIGDHTEISCDCSFVTHDGSTWVFRNQEKYKNVLRFGRIQIGDNCFVGARSIILPNVTIHDGSIIGAGSLVTKSVPAGEVWGGVPAKYITTVSEFAERCLAETPAYDLENYRKNFREEVMKITEHLN